MPSRPTSRPLAAEARRNRILANLPEAELCDLLPAFERVGLAPREVVAEPGRPVSHVHFPTGAVLSLVVVTADGASAEGGTVGREGAIGAVAGPLERGAFTRIGVSVAGPALRLPLESFEAARAASPALRDGLDRAGDALLAQLLQSVACNVLHPAETRLARWLLMTLDRVLPEASPSEPAELPLSHEAIAVMLGAHRVTVADNLADLDRAGLVRRGRGRVTVLDRAGLERRACECYAAVRDHLDRLLPAVDGRLA
jgi:hypothetical protein